MKEIKGVKMMIIQSKRVWVATQFLPMQLEIENNKIKAIHAYDTLKVDVDYGTNRIVPGFIDVHIHGGFGYDTNEPIFEGMQMLQSRIIEEGVTSFLPTTITQSEEVLTAALENVAKVIENPAVGANILGVHFEGPYLNMKYKGAQPGEHIVKPSIEQFKRFQAAAKGNIKLITMASEEDDNFELLHYLNETGVVASLGHTGATYEEALLGFANGVKSITHVYNGMSAYHHRDMNVQGASLRVHDVFGEIIVDGNHAHFAAVNNYMVAKGKDRVILITDALMAKGSPAGSEFIFGGHPIKVLPSGAAWLMDGNSLAGSTLRMNRGVQNIIEHVGLDWEYAINASSLNPARLLRVDDHKGYLKAGYDADFVVLNDDFDVVATYVLGQALYQG